MLCQDTLYDIISYVKANAVLSDDNMTDEDEALLEQMTCAAAAYAEGFQNREPGYYDTEEMTPNTKRAVIMLATHYWESRDSAAGGIWADSAKASEQSFSAINALLRLDREWSV